MRAIAVFIAAGGALPLCSQDAPKESPDAIINAYFEARWKEEKRKPGPVADAYAFYRRARLDLTGRMPTADQVRKEAKSKGRAKLVDELLGSPAGAEYVADLWLQWLNGYDLEQQDLFRCQFGALHRWLCELWAQGMPYDRMVRALLSDRGSPRDVPAANFALKHLVDGEPPAALAGHAARLFLGRDIRCAQCHDHPFEKVRQEEYWGFTAFFRPLRRGADGALVEGEPRSGKPRADLGELVQPAAFLDGRKPDASKPLGAQLAEFVLTTEKGEHAHAVVERMWRHFFGRPLGKEHAALRESLVRDFLANGQSLRRLVRGIAMSKPYQLASEGKDDDRRAYAVGPLKYMNPVQFFRAFEYAFGMRHYYEKEIAKRKKDPQTAALFADPQNVWLGVYIWAKDMILPKGRDPEEAIAAGTVRLALKFMNNRDLQVMLCDTKGPFYEIWKEKQSPEARIVETFLALLARPPTNEELAKFVDYMKSRPAGEALFSIQDVYWTLLNSGEFIFVR
jgi:hypothetical protein